MHFPSPIRFLADRRGNIAMMYALMLPVLMFGVGLAIDYTHAMQVQTKLDAVADAAALAALTPSMLQQSNSAGQTAATNLFNAEASAIPSLVPGKTVPVVTVTTPTGSPLVHKVTVTYTAGNTNIFAGILGYSAIAISGSSSATASAAANMNFYLLLDNSPSMALPSTTGGITTMQQNTPYQDYYKPNFNGCAFACHQATTGNSDTAGNPCGDGSTPNVSGSYTDINNNSSPSKPIYCSASHGTQIDNYALAKKLGIEMRLDDLATGVGDLTTYAEQFRTSQVSPPTYKFAAYSMDTSWQIGMVNTTTVSTSSNPTNELMAMTTGYVSGWQAVQNSNPAIFQVLEYYSNNVQCANAACTSGLAQSSYGNDWATNYDDALSAMNTIMPNPGQGTNVNGDTPKEVLFVVTDGVQDELNAPSCAGGQLNGTRCHSPITSSWCATIKGRGIYLAILYTDYYPVTSGSTYDYWYSTFVSPFQPQIAGALQTCASPGMFFDAAIGTNLGTGLKTLFTNVMAARLTQ